MYSTDWLNVVVRIIDMMTYQKSRSSFVTVVSTFIIHHGQDDDDFCDTFGEG